MGRGFINIDLIQTVPARLQTEFPNIRPNQPFAEVLQNACLIGDVSPQSAEKAAEIEFAE